MQHQMPNQKTLICITGTDGSGKSAFITELLKSIPSSREVSVIDENFVAGGRFFQSLKEFDEYLTLLTPDSRLLFIAHAFKYALDQAMKGKEKYLILNSYYYKYFAAELALGANTSLEKLLRALFPVPDKTILVLMNSCEAVKRKGVFLKYECGCKEPNPDNFCEFQKEVFKFIQEYAEPNWLILSGKKSFEENFTKICDYISITNSIRDAV